jgi:hypothetical protein
MWTRLGLMVFEIPIRGDERLPDAVQIWPTIREPWRAI